MRSRGRGEGEKEEGRRVEGGTGRKEKIRSEEGRRLGESHGYIKEAIQDH